MQLQVQCAKQLQLHIARMHDTNKMIIDDMRDYFKYIEEKNVASAKTTLDSIYFHCNTMIIVARNNTYKDFNPKVIESLVKEFEHLMVGLPCFEEVCQYYLDILNNKVDFKKLSYECKQEDKKTLMIAAQAFNKATCVEMEKEEALNNGKIKNETELESMEEQEPDAFDDCSLKWPRYISKYVKGFISFFQS